MHIIEVNHVTKEFRLGQLHSLKQSVFDALLRLHGRPVVERTPFKALEDVDFKVERGEVLGIIGQNGAGKSTLLKLLARISTPTHGNVKIRGTIAPLIEVGAGFVPDLTGRENIYLNGVILGMRRGEVKRKFDDIVAFAELEQFIDTPIKRYSSGMQVRLGFAVATSIDADILIVDEVLAVGDLAFQRKCFDRMEGLIKGRGNTVLLVSHNLRQVERLCTRVLLLDHGVVTLDGRPKDVCNAFYEATDKRIQENKIGGAIPRGRSESSGDIDIESVGLFDFNGRPIEAITYMDSVEFRVSYRVKNKVVDPIFGLGIHTPDFLYLATSQSLGSIVPGNLSPGAYTLRYRVHRFPFLPGTYSLRLGVALSQTFQPILYSENVIQLRVIGQDISRAIITTSKEGFVALDGEWDLIASDNATARPQFAVDSGGSSVPQGV